MTDRKWMYRHIVAEVVGKDASPASLMVFEDLAASPHDRVVEAAAQVQAVFDLFPELPRLSVYVEGEPVGVATSEGYPTAPHEPELGDEGVLDTSRSGEGDHSALTGISRRFNVFTFMCPECHNAVHTTVPDSPPTCPNCETVTG
ncbi:hypothetical protein OG524_13555 [Streptomyces sp. NBC_01520]|uniref:hypothetical protein n=1 Tax=Streptomyces sp. NBC_01520 TaxID=2903892 RepID=UPI0038641469